MRKPVIVLVLFLSFTLAAAAGEKGPAAEQWTWQDCLKQAAVNNPDLISAREQVVQAQADVNIAKSGLLPQVDLSAKLSSAYAAAGKSDNYSYGASASQLLFDGGKKIGDIMAAAQNMSAAQYSFKFSSSTVRWQLRYAFIDLLKAQEQLKISRDIYDIRRSNAMLVTLRYQSGLEHKGAMLTSEANLEQARADINHALRQIETAQRKLCREMGIESFIPAAVRGDFDTGGFNENEPDFTALAEDNPQLKKITAQKNSAAYGLKSSRAAFAPTLSASAGAGRAGSDWPPGQDQWNAGLSLSLPLFEGGRLRAQTVKSRSLLRQYQFNEKSTRADLSVALCQAWAQLRDYFDNVGVQKKFLDAAMERSRIAQGQYSLGLINFDSWIIIENDLVNAKKSFLNAQANALYARADWVQAKGEDLEYEK